MTNPTSNYSFQMPTATDLVTDLPADFEVFGQAVDTRLKALQPGTTLGDLAYSSATANTNTRLPIGTAGQVLSVVGGVPAWSSETGDISAVTAGTGISGGGTSGAVTITNDMATTITTNGDLLYGTGSGTYTRRAIGSTNQVLTVSGGIPTWATPASATASFSLLSTTSLSGASTTISGISSQNTLQLVIIGAQSATTAVTVSLQFNGDTAGNYGVTYNLSTWASSYAASNFNASSNFGDTEINFAKSSSAGGTIEGALLLLGSASTGTKQLMFNCGGTANGGSSHRFYSGGGVYKGTSTISSITVKCSGGTFNGGTAYLYGSSN